jgi:tRNA(fMet)-specific endonuclease VapC
MYALDTNTVIYFLRGEGRVAEHMLALPLTEIAVPAVVLYELEMGAAGSTQPARRRAQLDHFFRVVRILPFHDDAAKKAAQARAALQRPGGIIGPIDTLIAGTALAHGATLVTRNTREFRRVRGLNIENWY